MNHNLYEKYLELTNESIEHEKNYFHLYSYCDENGILHDGCTSSFSGFYDKNHQIELREARYLNPEPYITLLTDIVGFKPIIINKDYDWIYVYLIGGNAIVEESVAQKRFEYFVKPHPVVSLNGLGFTSLECIDDAILNRAPSKKLRMNVIKRDNHRCVICGRSPRNYVDLELHVHHIRPISLGGLTKRSNLITLCNTCHQGLEPHFDFNLFNFIEDDSEKVELSRNYIKEHYERMLNNFA